MIKFKLGFFVIIYTNDIINSCNKVNDKYYVTYISYRHINNKP